MIRVVRVIEYVYRDEAAMRSDQGKWASGLVAEHMTMNTIAVSPPVTQAQPGPFVMPTIGHAT